MHMDKENPFTKHVELASCMFLASEIISTILASEPQFTVESRSLRMGVLVRFSLFKN